MKILNNCWEYAVNTFIKREGFLVARLTKRSSQKPLKYFGWFGKLLLVFGLILVNLGFLIITGKWLHAYHCDDITGPYTSFEPIHGPILKYPPLNFVGKIVEKQTLK